MSNLPITTLPDSFPRALGSAFDPALVAQPSAETLQPHSAAQVKARPAGLISLLAKSLGVSRPDWRNHPQTRISYPGSRVSYVETVMTDKQAREFEYAETMTKSRQHR